MTRRRLEPLGPLGALVLLVACSSACRPTKRNDDPPSGQPHASDAAAGAYSDAKEAARLSAVAYHDALIRSRKATAEQDYPKAISAATDALTARPFDPHALVQRGHTLFLARQYASAKEDLESAERGAGKDKKLLAQVYFSLGLVAEAQNDDGAAYAAFASADRITPSVAAKAKIGVTQGRGKLRSLCGAELSHDAKPLAVSTELTNLIGRGDPSCVPVCRGGLFRWVDPANESLRDESCKIASCSRDRKGPFVIASSDPLAGGLALVVPNGRELLSTPLASIGGGMCGPGTYDVLLTPEAGYVHVRITHRWSRATSICRGGKNHAREEEHPCDDVSDEEPVGIACGDLDASTDQHVIINQDTKVLAAHVAPSGSASAPTITATTDGLVFRGAFCDRIVPWPPMAGDAGR